ncbi:MAG TPA: hypothetical protein PLK34_02735, partial [Candidatus Pacearchaeota archaeon]|nr:hypothetical protein [Candidatus Pacearchaeota archaeon]
SNKEFQKFTKKNPTAYLCSAFFIIDKENSNHKQHFDYFLPEENKIFSFQIEESCKQVPLDNLNPEAPEKILLENDLDFQEIEDLIQTEMDNQGIKNKIQKILFSMNQYNHEEIAIGTVFISNLGMIKLRMNLKDKKITDFKKESFMDMINIFKKK